MKKKFFNLAVAMSVIASSLAFTSCGDDDDEEDEPKKEQNTPNNNNNNNNNNDNNPVYGAATTSFTAVEGDEYLIQNDKLGISTILEVEKVSGTTVTLSVSGASVTIGSANADYSYAIYVAADGSLKAASMTDAKADAANVLFICKANSVIASGTEAASADINTKAGETKFSKLQD